MPTTFTRTVSALLVLLHVTFCSAAVVSWNETTVRSLALEPTSRVRSYGVIKQFHRIGGSGGSPFQVDQVRNGAVVEKLQVWSYRNSLAAIHLTFSNGHVEKIGDKGDHKHQGSFSIDYASGETVTELSIWGNGAGTRCGAFRIKTSKNRVFHPKMWKWGLKTEYKMDVGSGIILGAFGRKSGVVNSLGLLMLRKVAAVELEVSANQYSQTTGNLSPPRLISKYDLGHQNVAGTDNPWGKVIFKREQQETRQWSVTDGLTIGKEFSVKASVPKVVDVGVTASWEFSVSSTYTTSKTNIKSREVPFPYTIPAYSQVDVTLSYFEGTISNLPFTGKMRYYLDNGNSFYATVRGLYRGVSNTVVEQRTVVTHLYDPEKHTWTAVVKAPMVKRFDQ